MLLGKQQNNFIILLAALLLIIVISSQVSAEDIVNTGPGEGRYTALDYRAWRAAEFILDQDYIVTDAYGWIYGMIDDKKLTLAIYHDGGGVPALDQEIFSQKFTVANKFIDDWYGVTGLNLALSSGTYWLAFEVREGDTFFGGYREDPPNPVYREAVAYSGSDWVYVPYSHTEMGIKVQGYVNVVPEPISSTLFVSGGVLLIGRKYIRRKKTA